MREDTRRGYRRKRKRRENDMLEEWREKGCLREMRWQRGGMTRVSEGDRRRGAIR